jgi:imidazole glycerol-phosphate synthase subunit HisF
MLKKRLIPKLLIKHRALGRVVRPVLVTTRGYRDAIEVGDPVSQAKIYEAQLADELVVLNIDGAPIRNDETMLGLIERLAGETFMPLCVGGGVRSADDFAQLLERGADKVSINTVALEHPQTIGEAAGRYGAQCVVVSIDYRVLDDGSVRVMQHHGSRDSGRELLDWAREAVDRGAGELLLCDVERDGSGTGLSWSVGREVALAVPVPVVLSGGCGLAEHFVEGFRDGLAEGVAAGTFFSFRDQGPMQTRAHIRNGGIPIRMET